MEESEIHIKTEEVNELLTAVPGWIINRGITIVFAVMFAALTLSYFIKYPDTLKAKAVLTSINPPVTLVSKINGKISELMVQNDQQVKSGDVLLIIESTANYQHIGIISDILSKVSPLNLNGFQCIEGLKYDTMQLGDITPAFLQFMKSYSDYKLFSETNPQQREIEIIEKQLISYGQLQTKYQKQISNYKEELALVESDFSRSNFLFETGAISAKDLEGKKREWLTAKSTYENANITGINNKVIITNLQKNKLQLEMLKYQEEEKFEQSINQSLQTLKSQIETWEQLYLFRSPIDGTVSLFSFWTNNQNINQGDKAISIVPSSKQEIIAKLILPVQNSGKLKEGQVVNIKLNNYQYQEYGMVQGIIKHIAIMPQEQNYSVEVALPAQLKTTFNKQLGYKEEMQGSADIITEELSILHRVFFRFRGLFK